MVVDTCFSFSIDGTPIREFNNMESKGVAFPKNQSMRYTLTFGMVMTRQQGGLVKNDWSQAPFIASYRNSNADACVHWGSSSSSCSSIFISFLYHLQQCSREQDDKD
ncbi:hypothetical protein V8G54_018831 [Vigna mungo]|uniref:Uncharacterized protein n=1 Tax=Vigna mungo TaxID=3915 RepID=A0AAQ3NAJ9_VIGMU